MRHNNEVTKDSRHQTRGSSSVVCQGIGFVRLGAVKSGLDSDHLSTLEAAALI